MPGEPTVRPALLNPHRRHHRNFGPACYAAQTVTLPTCVVMRDDTVELVPVDDAMRAELRDALGRSDLPGADIDEAGRRFFAACVDKRTVGFVGLEIHGADVLVRSLVVLERERRKGFGSTLLRSALRIAAAQGVERAWALTMMAQSLLENVGFQPAARTAAPPSIQATQEFIALCPASAVCMTRAI